MSFPTKEEILAACAFARGLDYSIESGLTVASKRCCPLGAVLLARGLDEEWVEGISDWLDLADLLRCDPEEVEAFTNSFDDVPNASHPLGSELKAIRDDARLVESSR